MNNQIIIAENFFQPYLQKKYKNFFFGDQIAWNFNQHATSDQKEYYGLNVKEDSSFAHILDETQKDSKVFLDQVKSNIREKFGIEVKETLRARLRFSMPNPLYEDDWYLPPHTDFKTPHKTLIYYINDNDAETLFFNKKYDSEFKYDEEMKVIKKIKPKQGTAVLFDGLIFHAARASRTKLRMLLNFNFL